ncbi:hypothetical protein ABIE67_009114 [Streptomyces sp. V4I8]|uniref:hypothetical protein n=1 Tax=Streptomyces sp. V4I8 TaxID=3156469 RepID=UPI0035111AD0
MIVDAEQSRDVLGREEQVITAGKTRVGQSGERAELELCQLRPLASKDSKPVCPQTRVRRNSGVLEAAAG